jgi:hypothetical protein
VTTTLRARDLFSFPVFTVQLEGARPHGAVPSRTVSMSMSCPMSKSMFHVHVHAKHRAWRGPRPIYT